VLRPFTVHPLQTIPMRDGWLCSDPSPVGGQAGLRCILYEKSCFLFCKAPCDPIPVERRNVGPNPASRATPFRTPRLSLCPKNWFLLLCTQLLQADSGTVEGGDPHRTSIPCFLLPFTHLLQTHPVSCFPSHISYKHTLSPASLHTAPTNTPCLLLLCTQLLQTNPVFCFPSHRFHKQTLLPTRHISPTHILSPVSLHTAPCGPSPVGEGDFHQYKQTLFSAHSSHKTYCFLCIAPTKRLCLLLLCSLLLQKITVSCTQLPVTQAQTEKETLTIETDPVFCTQPLPNFTVSCA